MPEAEVQTQEEATKTPFYSKRPAPVLSRVDPEQKQRVKLWMGWCLIITALVVDVAELGLSYTGVGIFFAFILSIGAGFVFWLWFLVLGVTYSSNTKTFATSIVTYLAELIPGLDIVPFWFAWTVGMLLIVTLTRMEDRGEEPTILGALGRIFTWAGGPVTIAIRYPFQKFGDVRRSRRIKREYEKEMEEILENPEMEEEIKEKYAKRERRFRRRELNPAERLERRFFQVGKDGVSLREGKNIGEAREAFDQFGQKQKGLAEKKAGEVSNTLNLKIPRRLR